jgi:hypothetical protein
VRPFCPSRRVFSSPQRKVCIAAAVVGSHPTLFHPQPSQSSRTISDSTPTIAPPRTTQDTAGGCGVRRRQHVKRLRYKR